MGLNTAFLGRITGYGAGGGSYGIGQSRRDELASNLRMQQWKKGDERADEQLEMLKADYADKKKRYEDLLAQQRSQTGLATGGGGQAWRRGAYTNLYGEDYQPTPDQLSGVMGLGPSGRANFVNSNVDLSDPVKALNAARYARSLAEWNSAGRGAALNSANPYLDIEKRILNSLRG